MQEYPSVCHAGLRSPQSGTIGPLYFDARVVKACHRAEDGRVEVEVDLARVVRGRMTAGCDPLTDRVVGLEYVHLRVVWCWRPDGVRRCAANCAPRRAR